MLVGRYPALLDANVLHPAFVRRYSGWHSGAEVFDKNLYVNPRGNRAHHLCACGCGNRVMTPLNELEWSLAGPDEAPSLHPSVGNWNLECRSHYVLRDGKVMWARSFTQAEIVACRAKDLRPYLQTSWREKIRHWSSRTVRWLRGIWK